MESNTNLHDVLAQLRSALRRSMAPLAGILLASGMLGGATLMSPLPAAATPPPLSPTTTTPSFSYVEFFGAPNVFFTLITFSAEVDSYSGPLTGTVTFSVRQANFSYARNQTAKVGKCVGEFPIDGAPNYRCHASVTMLAFTAPCFINGLKAAYSGDATDQPSSGFVTVTEPGFITAYCNAISISDNHGNPAPS